jgi:large subunit ribosomal protein L24
MSKESKPMKVHVKTGDTVIILTGKYEDKFDKDGKRKTGKVLQVSPKEGKVIVEGRNMVTKHVKPRKMGAPGGIVQAESALYASKVQLVCPSCGKPTRIGHRFLQDGTKERMCKKCGEAI